MSDATPWVCDGRLPTSSGVCPCGHASNEHVRIGGGAPITCDRCAANRILTSAAQDAAERSIYHARGCPACAGTKRWGIVQIDEGSEIWVAPLADEDSAVDPDAGDSERTPLFATQAEARAAIGRRPRFEVRELPPVKKAGGA